MSAADSTTESDSDDEVKSQFALLRDELYKGRVESAFEIHNPKFWPEGTIQKLIKGGVIRKVFDEAKGRYNDESKGRYNDDLVEFIVNDAKKIFAISAIVLPDSVQLLKAMKSFKSKQFRDSDLYEDMETSERLINEDPTALESKLPEINSKVWDIVSSEAFNEKQWMARVPVFSTSEFNYNFKSKTILPFDTMEENVKSGAFSRVHKVSIYPGHYRQDGCSENERPSFFAVKQIIPPNDENQKLLIAKNWGNEAETLKKMNERSKDHVIRFITAFKRGTVNREISYYLMFEWADGGSLEDVWKEDQTPVLNAELVKGLVKQLLGLAKALHATHYPEDEPEPEPGISRRDRRESGFRHGDLKPDNILRFRPTAENPFGTLKLGDWGLAKYHNIATVMRRTLGEQTTTNYGTILYEPPEVEIGQGKVLGRQYDIWSIGCVILEAIIWLLYGYKGVELFRAEVKGRSNNSAACYEIVGEGNQKKAKVRGVVVTWMDHMAKDPSCDEDTAIGELLKLVRTRLLVVELPPLEGQTVFQKDLNPPAKTLRPSLPQIKFSNSSEASQEPGHRLQLYRAIATELMDYLDDGILDDEDRQEDFWFRKPPTDFERQPPKSQIKPPQDSTSHLLPNQSSKDITKQASTGRSGSVGQEHLAVQNLKIVSRQ